MTTVPNVYHFIFGMTPDFGGKPFSYIHYRSIISCRDVNRPDAIRLYFAYRPHGKWWTLAEPYVDCIQVAPISEIFGRPIVHPAHRTDVLRLQVLIEHGGVYMDLDVISLRPLLPLLETEVVVLGEETGSGLCNAVIIAPKNAAFLKAWLSTFRSFVPKDWSGHAVKMPWRLANRFPHLIHVQEPRSFFWPMYWSEHRRVFYFLSGGALSKDAYCVHLWEQINWPFLREMTPVHAWLLQSEFTTVIFKDSGGWQNELDLEFTDQETALVVSSIVERLGFRVLDANQSIDLQLKLIRSLVIDLSETEREVFVLYFFFGMTSNAIARFTQRTVDDVNRCILGGWQIAGQRWGNYVARLGGSPPACNA